MFKYFWSLIIEYRKIFLKLFCKNIKIVREISKRNCFQFINDQIRDKKIETMRYDYFLCIVEK